MPNAVPWIRAIVNTWTLAPVGLASSTARATAAGGIGAAFRGQQDPPEGSLIRCGLRHLRGGAQSPAPATPAWDGATEVAAASRRSSTLLRQ